MNIPRTNIPLLNDQELHAFMWLAYAKEQINLAGGSVSMDYLQQMPLIEFAKICGMNNIKIVYEKQCYHK